MPKNCNNKLCESARIEKENQEQEKKRREFFNTHCNKEKIKEKLINKNGGIELPEIEFSFFKKREKQK